MWSAGDNIACRSESVDRPAYTAPRALIKPFRLAADLSAPEIAFGMPIGFDSPSTPLERRPDPPQPALALERVLLAALRRPPCVISFSGGRDSSAMLALAARVARRESLPLPVPVTLRFPGSHAADEDEWQSAVVRHLALQDWVRLDITGDEFDVVGPVARECLSRHGLLWPFNAHFHWPILRIAGSGTVVTGFGGDEIALSSTTARAEQVLSRRRRPHLVDALVVGLALSPRSLRAGVLRRRFLRDDRFPWLTARGLAAVGHAVSDAEARVPLGWSSVVRQAIWRSRYFSVCQHNFAAMGAAVDTDVLHPFLHPLVLDSLASKGGFGGLGSRTEIMRLLCGDALPVRVLERKSKGSFTRPTWTDTARSFAAQWSGGGVDEALVDPAALRAHWISDDVNLLASTLLQAAWLHENAPHADPTGNPHKA
jgi:Asparagine synthase